MGKTPECTCPSRQLFLGLPDGETHSIMCPMRRRPKEEETSYDSIDDEDYEYWWPYLGED